jgi:SSS family solute:Na+ symporter
LPAWITGIAFISANLGALEIHPTHVFNALTFAVATVLIAGVNLYALALIMHLMVGSSIAFSIVIAAAIVRA